MGTGPFAFFSTHESLKVSLFVKQSDIPQLFSDPSPDAARVAFREKAKGLRDKIMTVKDAVAQFVRDGDYLASGGFGGDRIATAALHEIVRQRRQNLSFAGHTATHDFQ